jgi:hypothetical protein
MNTRALVRFVLPLAGALAVAGCDQPPNREIQAGEAALAQAKKDLADAYSPEQWKAAEAALAQARQKVEAKDYRGALSSAMDAGEKARAADAAVASAKVLAKGAADMAQAEVQAALDEVITVKDEALKARVPDEAFAELSARVQEATDGLAALAAHVGKEELLDAQKLGAELKTKFAGLGTEYRAALDKWLEEHPKGRKPAKKK